MSVIFDSLHFEGALIFDALIFTPEAVDTPDPFTLGLNVTGLAPGSEIIRSFIISGSIPGLELDVTPLGAAEARVNAGAFSADPTTAYVGDIIHVRLVAGAWATTVSGGVDVHGVSSQFSITSEPAPPVTPPGGWFAQRLMVVLQ